MSGKVNSSNQLSPSGVICWTDDEYKAYLTAWGCMPKGLIYRVTSATSDCIFVGSGADDVADEKIWCADFNPDVICDFTSVVDPTDSAYILYCSGGEVMKAKWEDFFSKTCFDLPSLPASNCKIVKTAYAKDADGCGRLYTYTGEPVPEGFQLITKSIAGTVDKVVDGNPEFSATDIGFSNSDWVFYQIFKGSRTFTIADHCQLGEVGLDVNILSDSRVNYFMDMNNPQVKTLAPYQFGTAVFVNGSIVAVNLDLKAVNQSGNNSELTDLIQGAFTTDGTNLVVEVCLLLGVDTTDPRVTIGDMISMDQAQIGITMSVAS